MMNQQMLMKIKKMQKQMEETQRQLEETVYTGTAGGMVTVQVKGDHTVLDVKIDMDEADRDDLDMLQDTIIAALNDATNKLNKDAQDKMAPYTSLGGFGF